MGKCAHGPSCIAVVRNYVLSRYIARELKRNDVNDCGTRASTRDAVGMGVEWVTCCVGRGRVIWYLRCVRCRCVSQRCRLRRIGLGLLSGIVGGEGGDSLRLL